MNNFVSLEDETSNWHTQTFEKIRVEKLLYIDKTEQIYRIISTGDYFFLSRPRRFGKPLFYKNIVNIY